MVDSEIRIQQIKIKELEYFSEQVIAASNEGQFIPISMQRAQAHAHNPYASKEDVALLVAIDSDDEIVGYFGILPLLLRHGKSFNKVHWFTTWNVSAKVRGRGVGGALMAEALTLGYDFLIVGSVYARRVCRNYGFLEREPLVYFWLDPSGMTSLNPMVWIKRGYRKLLRSLGIKKHVEINTPLSKALSNKVRPLTSKFFSSHLSKVEAELSKGFNFQEVDQIHAAPKVPPHLPEVELHRGIDAVNWMLAYPWVLEKGSSVTEKMDYYFSDSRTKYQQIAVEVFGQDGHYIGFAVFSVSQQGAKTSLKTRDFQFEQPSYERVVLGLALKYARMNQAEAIELPAQIIKYLPRRLRSLLLQPKERIYQCMPKSDESPLAQNWPDIQFQLWDGDMAFS
jgi:hypothetical protein